MTTRTINRAEMIDRLDSEGLPRHIAEGYCDITLFEILNDEISTRNTSQANACVPASLGSMNTKWREEKMEVSRQRTINNGHLGGMHRIAASLTKSEDTQC
ncbi:hypothetical protein L2729_16975 [Shewanella gelidimarina]|uniref:hypothetical protein n=1 Tax=Shewanella gelidimarina TaxID=56813 RepID=UPI00200F858E|nr:hypothetical protein [Shewanella gelidimarina]MCL1059665.1 hypothetical protein [Shewanella gelidimarina]